MSDTLTQDDLRQLHEAGCPFVGSHLSMGGPKVYGLSRDFTCLTPTALLVGYATQLLEELYPGEMADVSRFKTYVTFDTYSGNRVGYPSLVAMIVDLATQVRQKKVVPKSERCKHCGIELPRELYATQYCGPRCYALAGNGDWDEQVKEKKGRVDKVFNVKPSTVAAGLRCIVTNPLPKEKEIEHGLVVGDEVITVTLETVHPYANVVGPRSMEGVYTKKVFHTYTFFGGCGLGCLIGELYRITSASGEVKWERST